ncbi:MAG: hypothetical protein ACTSVV_03365 [Promethearchaeota archaeon]
MKLNLTNFKILCFYTVVINILYIIGGIIHLIYPVYSIFSDIIGAIIIITWISNFVFVYIDDLVIVKNNTIGKKINLFGYFFLVIFILCMLLLVISEGIMVLTVDTQLEAFILPYTILGIGFFGIAAFAIILVLLNLKNLNKRGVWRFA